ncbi:MAG: YihY/virulence factor BrkB family protein, partial [Lysinibacillus sp.]
LLSFFPLLIFLVTLLPFLNLQVEQIYDFLQNVMPESVYGFIESTLAEILTSRNGGLLSIGVLATIWSASKGINALMRALNTAYDTKGRRGIFDWVLSLVFTIALVCVIAIALVLPVFGQQIGMIMFSFIGVEESFIILWHNIRWTMPPILIFLVLYSLYWLVPNTDPRLNLYSVWPGTLFSTIAWLVLTYGFSFYINHFGNYSATYGSIGGVIILMLWLYFTGMILIFGGLLNAAMQKRTKAKLKKKQMKMRNY